MAGRVCLITGSTGMAAATARLAAAEGARVFVTSRTEAHLKELADEIRAAGGTCEYRAADLREEGAIAPIFDQCVGSFGRVDAVYNVAGASGRPHGDGPVHLCSTEGWDITYEDNLRTLFFMCREAARRMLEQTPDERGIRGAILNMSSVLALEPRPDHFATHAYASAKAAALCLTESMAAYYAPHGIRVNAIAPGLVRTPMSRRSHDNPVMLELMKTRQPLGGAMLEADDIAQASVYLLSAEASRVTGQVMTVDGGWSVSP